MDSELTSRLIVNLLACHLGNAKVGSSSSTSRQPCGQNVTQLPQWEQTTG